MKRGLGVALVAGLVVIAAVIAGTCAFFTGILHAYTMRATSWHGRVESLSSRESAVVDGTMLATFAGVFGLELALIIGGVLSFRYFQRAAAAARSSAPRPLVVAVVQVLLVYKGLTSVAMLSLMVLVLTFDSTGALMRQLTVLPLVLVAVFFAARATVARSPKSRVTLLAGFGVISFHALVTLAEFVVNPLDGGSPLAWLGALFWPAVTLFVATSDSISSYLSRSDALELEV